MEVFKLFIELIGTLNNWPFVFLIVVLIFRKKISTALPDISQRLRKLIFKYGDTELEVHLTKEELSRSLASSQSELPEHPISRPIVDTNDKEQRAIEESKHNTDIDKVLEAAQTNPKIAVIQLASLIERELRTIVALLGLPGPQTTTTEILTSEMPPTKLGEILVGHKFLPQSTTNSLKTFWQLYARIIHGREHIHEDTILGILDSGVVLLGRIRSIPHEINIVEKTSIDLFSDEQCTTLRRGVKGLILESTTIGKTRTYKRIFPTTNWQYYQPEKRVTWEWNLTKSWKDTWYIDPDTSEKKVAWSSAGEFVGRHVEELV